MINYYSDGFYERLNASRWCATVGQKEKIFSTEKGARRWIYNGSRVSMIFQDWGTDTVWGPA